MTDPRESEDLDALLRSAGWLRFAEHARIEWGEKIQSLLKRAASDTDDVQALHKLRQVMVAKDAIDTLIAWPKDRLNTLKAKAQNAELASSVPLSRRGEGL